MQALLSEVVLNNAIGLLLGIVIGWGVPVVVRLLRVDSNKKLTDKDKSNDIVGIIEETLADTIEKNKDRIAKQSEDLLAKKKNK